MNQDPILTADDGEDNGKSIFYRYAPFIQDFIYRNHWAALRGVQLAKHIGIEREPVDILLRQAGAVQE